MARYTGPAMPVAVRVAPSWLLGWRRGGGGGGGVGWGRGRLLGGT